MTRVPGDMDAFHSSLSCVCEIQLIVGYVQIWATMNNCAGVSRDVMLSQDALEAIVNKTLEQLRNPGLQCLHMVTTELMRITEECTPPEISRCCSRASSFASACGSHARCVQ
jgi:Dynamin central region